MAPWCSVNMYSLYITISRSSYFIGFIKDCIALTMDEAKANLNNEQLGFYKKILTQKRKEIKEKIEKEMNLVEN